MKVGIHSRWDGLLEPEINIYRKILEYNNIEYVILNASDINFWDQIKEIDAFIYKWGHDHTSRHLALSIIPVIEKAKIPCFPNIDTCWHYDDKVKQYYLLRNFGFPAVESFVCWQKDKALQWIIENNEWPVVFKLRNGAGSMSVKLLNNKSDANSEVKRLFGYGISQYDFNIFRLLKTFNFDFKKVITVIAVQYRGKYFKPELNHFWERHKNYFYTQKFLKNNEYDTRVTTAGDKVHAFRRFVRKDDFRASGSNNWDINPDKIDKRFLKIALEISKNFGFQAMAYDFIYDENKEPAIIEMSYLYGGAGYPDFMNGFWDSELNWHEGRYWPQYFELIDLLNIPELKLPILDTNTTYKKARIISNDE